MKAQGHFYKEKPTDKVYWLDNPDVIGEFVFSFDKKNTFNLFADYPHKLTKEQKAIFDKENPYWVNFFKDRTNT
ncbi:MAG: hypothetical protein J6X32_05420 [Salinivirgaceae bacterium]|nr:hypothetical protein [Salinivirgaceae bacterium]